MHDATNAADEQQTVIVHHRPFRNEEGDRHEAGADLGMGLEFANDQDVHVEDVWEDYEEAGQVNVPSEEDVEHMAAQAYSAWEQGEGHSPEDVRSMATGDVLEVGDRYFFVDSIGFEEIEL